MPTGTAQDLVWDENRLADPHAQPDKAARVQAMFDAIAPTYERVNRVLSAGRDAAWRREAVKTASVRPDDRILDLACGTGDFARAFATACPALVVGADFAWEMLGRGAARHGPRLRWCQADALRLPFADGMFTVVSCAFGVRNFQNLCHALREMHRVLAPGGRAVILEFSTPSSRILAPLYLFYFRRIMPRLAGLLSGDRTGAYHYLPHSVSSFTDAAGLGAALQTAGFGRLIQRRLSFGIVTLHVGYKDA
jgi:demethylmenaquinone methyltransferase/2-methoxy-6-polyprenyl-1,4-benzoquinol methylase